MAVKLVTIKRSVEEVADFFVEIPDDIKIPIEELGRMLYRDLHKIARWNRDPMRLPVEGTHDVRTPLCTIPEQYADACLVNNKVVRLVTP